MGSSRPVMTRRSSRSAVRGDAGPDAKWRNIGQFRRCWCGSQTVGGAPDENCFTMSRTGGMGIKSAPCLKSKRRFRPSRTITGAIVKPSHVHEIIV